MKGGDHLSLASKSIQTEENEYSIKRKERRLP